MDTPERTPDRPRAIAAARIIAALVAILVLCGCAQDAVFTPKSNFCGFKRHVLATNVTDGMTGSSDRSVTGVGFAPDSLAGTISSSLQGRPQHGLTPEGGAPAFLFLSGGGQHGAFGAGFIDQWRVESEKRHHSLPQFQMVTGISTGSIQASFAFAGMTALAVDGYTIPDESVLLTPLAKPSAGGGLGASAGLALARQGAVADLTPLYDHLDRHLTDEVLRRVAQGADQGRQLFVGVVDVDSGEAVAFDMGDMAQRYAVAQPQPPVSETALAPGARRLKDCYIAAIVASSSAPIAARPVFIDNRMYIDGGARFGLFGAEIGAVIDDRKRLAAIAGALPGQPPPVPITFAIVNGTLQTGVPATCPWADATLCRDGMPSNVVNSPHNTWSFLGLALRSEEVLSNQIYRFSAQRVGTSAGDCQGCFNFVRIEPDSQQHMLAIGNETKTCQQWRDDDRKRLNPIQFFPNYMRCIIDYGRSRPEVVAWAKYRMK
ncbi:patatin-like phospholipase family protein [Novosphingobium lentum]|uniref:patatin-like phospholipase family protein n=1 Tax=Novosphingobium lentum TaxID=145287 RepID=UPI00083128A7|nr:patatin-like phospholipase family protein [Novosphingobium lentum]